MKACSEHAARQSFVTESSWGRVLEDIIKNKRDLSSSPARAAALEIVEAGIRRVLPQNVVAAALDYDSTKDVLIIQGCRFELQGRRVFVVGGGKASGEMARIVETIVGAQRLTSGLVTVKHGDSTNGTRKIEIVTAGHPVPDERGVEAVNRMLGLKAAFELGSDDLILCLLSGGGSALLPCPADGIALEDKQRVTGLLLSSGADISEVNAVRKHLSKTKGGGLGSFFAPASVVSLILSDVIGNDLSVIASGPTYPDDSTFSDAVDVLVRYKIADLVPRSVLRHLKAGAAGLVPETPKVLTNCRNFVIGDVSLALDSMKTRATDMGLHPIVVTSQQRGEPGEAAGLRAREVLDGRYEGFNVLLVGGETTPRLPPIHGTGGRNQHYAAASLLEMRGYSRPWTIASVGTDGTDYLPDVAGAIVDQSTLTHLFGLGVDVPAFVSRYDSYGLFGHVRDCLVFTGSTGTNVGDVVVYMLG